MLVRIFLDLDLREEEGSSGSFGEGEEPLGPQIVLFIRNFDLYLP